jgi:threonine dehydrogenase-like Zn-dependent dehydrogenase
VRAAVTTAKERMEVVDLPEPAGPAAGQVVVRPEAVGLCGSDFHYFLGHLGEMSRYPRVQGHEVSAVVEEVGSGVSLGLGSRVALWPVRGCGECYPCSLGRENVCANLTLIGVHMDGALQERLTLPAAQVFPVGDQDASVTALVEPVSIAVRAVRRGRVAQGEKVVVLGAGPIGQALVLAALDLGARVVVLDRIEHRLELAEALGADTLPADDGWQDAVREWAGGEAPEVVFEATGVPELVDPATELVAHAGRVVVVGLSTEPAPLEVGRLPFKELDLLGTSCCSADDFAEAVALVGRRKEDAAKLVTHEFPLERAPEAIAFAIENPTKVMKAVVRVDR